MKMHIYRGMLTLNSVKKITQIIRKYLFQLTIAQKKLNQPVSEFVSQRPPDVQSRRSDGPITYKTVCVLCAFCSWVE